MSQLCTGCEHSLKSNQRRTLKSSEKAQSFLITFGKIAELSMRSTIKNHEVYLCKPCYKVLEEGRDTIQQLQRLLTGCRRHFDLASLTIATVEGSVKDLEEEGT